jgi:hypothetical protein
MNNMYFRFSRHCHSPVPRLTAGALLGLAFALLIPTSLTASNIHKVTRLGLQCRSGKQKACDELAKIAVKERDVTVRRFAVAKLTDQSLLAKIAVEDRDDGVREAALLAVMEQSLLAKVAVEATDARIRSDAMAKLTEQSALAKVAVEATDARVRTAAVAKLTEQSALARVAVEATDASTRSAAVAKLTEQSLLAKIAVEDKEASVRFVAAGRLTDRSLLAKIVVEDKDAIVRLVAAARLNNQSLLAKIAVEATDARVGSAAVSRMTDQSLLAKVAVEATDASVRSTAIAQLTDQSLLAKIAVQATDATVGSAAVSRLADQSLLAKIAVEATDASVRSAAVAAAEQVRRDFAGRDIVDLLNEKKIEIQPQGNGIQRVSLRIRRLVPHSFTVRIPAGTFFVSSNPSSQNMVTTRESKVQVVTDEWVSASVIAACANRPRHVPGSGDSFTVMRSPNQEELTKLMPVLDSAQLDTETRQAAVWIVTDNADYGDLGILVYGSGFGGSRAIREQQAARAMKICDQAGIDITLKAVWRDRQRIIAGLPDGDLKIWLDNKK